MHPPWPADATEDLGTAREVIQASRSSVTRGYEDPRREFSGPLLLGAARRTLARPPWSGGHLFRCPPLTVPYRGPAPPWPFGQSSSVNLKVTWESGQAGVPLVVQLGMHEAPLDARDQHLDPIPHREFLAQMGHVGFHTAVRDGHALGDLIVVEPLGDPLERFEFARRELGRVRVGSPGCVHSCQPYRSDGRPRTVCRLSRRRSRQRPASTCPSRPSSSTTSQS